MNDASTGTPARAIELAYDFPDPPHKVWRAISLPAFRETWLPSEALADPEPATVSPGREVRYRMRDATAPFLESTVTFRIGPNATGGTTLRIVHELTDARLTRMTTLAANDNRSTLMLAA